MIDDSIHDFCDALCDIWSSILAESGNDLDDVDHLIMLVNPDYSDVDDLTDAIDYMEDCGLMIPIYLMEFDDVEDGDIVPGIKFDDDDNIWVNGEC